MVARVAALSIRPTLCDRIKGHQKRNQSFECIKSEINLGKRKDFTIADDKILYYQGRLCVPDFEELKREILEEAHSSPYSVHPGSTKMYNDLKAVFWWEGMKRDIAEYVNKCLVYQQVKAEHQRSSGLLEPLEIPEWKWEHVTMDFVIGFLRSARGYEAI